MTEAASGAAGGRVGELWRYPVKSFQGERVESLEIGPKRVAGDREWALIDTATGKLLSAKTVPVLLDATAVTGRDGVTIRLPTGDEIIADGSTASDGLLSDWVGRPVSLQPAGDAPPDLVYEMTFDPPDDDAQAIDIPSPPGTFLDLAALHLLAAATLATCERQYPAGDWNRRRFRPNVFVEGAEGEYPEDEWVGRNVRLGSARLNVLMRTVRCAMPLRAQPAAGEDPPLARDVEIFQTMRDAHDNHLGVYATVVDPGTVSVGDAIVVE